MKKIILSMLILTILFFSVNSSMANTERTNITNNISEYPTIDDVNVLPLEKNEELLNQIEDEPLTTFTSGNKGNCAVIIKQFMPHSLDYCMKITCQFAIDVLQNKGYENILYIDTPTIRKLKNDLVDFVKDNIGGENKLFIFLFGHGSRNVVQINPLQLLTSYRFAKIVDDASSKASLCTVLIESCYCGSFIDELSSSNRIVITSTDHDSTAYGSHTSYSIFTGAFFSSLNSGKNFAECWEDADAYIASNQLSYRHQNPQLEDTGNGYGVGNYNKADNLPMHDGHESNMNKKDGKLAENSNIRSRKINEIYEKLLTRPIFSKLIQLINLKLLS